MNKINWEDYFFSIVDLIAKRSSCLKMQVGAVIVENNQILSTGYNGPASGIKHCDICTRIDMAPSERREWCPAVHAEINAILLAAKKGVSVNNSSLYCKYFPCSYCLSCLITAGIKEVIYEIDYEDVLNKSILLDSNMIVKRRNVG